ncbi:MAG: alpha/beta hydrolase [Candidatus Saccharimonas sp.]
MSQSVTLADGTVVRYHSYHDDQPITVVMIHGITGNHKGFQYLLPGMSNVHCIVPDLPGFGDSDLPPRESWSIEGLARAANEFVTALRLPTPPVLLGHSMGGLVASNMIALAPELYEQRAILISPVPTAVRRREARTSGAIAATVHYRVGTNFRSIVTSKLISRVSTVAMLKTNDRTRRRDIYRHHLDNLRYFSDSAFYLALHKDIICRGALDFAAALQAKRILLISGDDDIVTPLPEMKRLADAIHPERFLIIRQVGHLIHYEKAPEATAAINQFLTDQP